MIWAASACSRSPTSPPIPPSASPSFEGIGDLRGGDFHSEALAISNDGRVIVGRSSSAYAADEGFYRVTGDTLTPLLGAGGAHVSSEPRAITSTGDVIAGKLNSPALEAARWTAASGWTTLGDIVGGGVGSQVLGMSADASVLVGWGTSTTGYEATRWVNGSPIAMGDLAGGVYNSAAALVTADGGTIVGTGHSGSGGEVFVWKLATGMVGLGEPDGGEYLSEPFGMTPDASVIVGRSGTANGTEAFRWTQAGGFLALGDLAGGAFESFALDVSADGTVVVGFGTTGQGPEAFLWDATNGMRRVQDVLGALGVSAVSGWVLTEATGISADGRIVVGNGTDPTGHTQGWVARLR